MTAAGEVIDFGRRKRCFTGAAREAALIRTRWCTHPGCRRPARYCQIDHHRPWYAHGVTDLANADTRCGHHNRAKHHHDLQRWGPPPPQRP